MKNIHSIEFYTGSKEELLPDFEKDFPYIASRAELDKYIGGYVPWHWHRTVELFYMEIGSIESVGGKTLEEGYYQELATVYAGYAAMIRATGIFFSSILAYIGLKN